MKRERRNVRAVAMLGVTGLIAGLVPLAVSSRALAVDFDVSGTVFNDANGDGLSAGDSGVSGVTITAYDSTGAQVGTVMSGPTGFYVVNVIGAATDDVRIEFSGLPGNFVPGPIGSSATPDNGTSVQFVSSETGQVDFGIVDPVACAGPATDGATLYTSCFARASSTGPFADDGVIISIPADGGGVPSSNTASAAGADTPAPVYHATHGQVGTVNGSAVAPTGDTLYAAAYIKRSAGFGPGGQGAIYAVPTDGPGGADPTVLVDLNSLFAPGTAGHTGDVELPTRRPSVDGAASTAWETDKDAANAVGRSGLGDLDISDDGSTLYAVNMQIAISGPTEGQAHVVVVPTVAPTAANISTLAIPNICANSDDRPFALDVRGSDLYVGGVCSGEVSLEGNTAWVQKYDGTSWATVIAPQVVVSSAFDRTGGPNHWSDITGTSVWFINDPGTATRGAFMLTDIEFVGDDIVIGLRPRYADLATTGGESYGAVYRFCNSGVDTYTFEGGSGCIGPNSGAWYQGPGAPGDALPLGALAVNPVTDELIVTSSNPNFVTQSGGLVTYDNATGDRTRNYQAYTGSVGTPTFGKNAGIGDVELFAPVGTCTLPVEIGNFVWDDLDGDGVQDPGEPAIGGVTVNLYDSAGTLVQMTTTDAVTGEYYFVVDADTEYTIRLDNPADYTTGGPLEGEVLTTSNAADPGGDVADSDGVVGNISGVTGPSAGDFPEINLTSPSSGTSDHTYDFGFTRPFFDLALQKSFVTAEQPIEPGSLITWQVVVTNQGSEPVREIDVRDYPVTGADLGGEVPAPEDLLLVAPTVIAPAGFTASLDTGAAPGDPQGRVINVVGDSATDVLDKDETITLQFQTRVAATWDGSDFVNWAEISRFDSDDDRSNGDSDPTNPGNPPGGPLLDVDSTPDQSAINDDAPTDVGEPGDDVINEDGTNGGDEDDHDIAGVPLYDLALIKELSAAQPFLIDIGLDGDDLLAVFDITVKNQGNTIAYNIDVTDYFPTGMEYAPDPANAANAAAAPKVNYNGDGTFRVDSLTPSEELTFSVTARITDTSQAEFLNGAEISGFDADADPTNPPSPNAVDIDSTPDPVDGDDVSPDATNPNDPRNSHNDIDNDRGPGNTPIPSATTGDEDDHDVELLQLPFDLALQKRLASTPDVSVGGLVPFVLLVGNQGRTVVDIDLADYLGPHYRFDPADNTVTTTVPFVGTSSLGITYPVAAVPVNGTVNIQLDGTLSGGDVVIVPVNVRVDNVADQMDNFGEISRFDDDGDPTTGDSDPSNPDNPPSGELIDRDSTPDAIDKNGEGENRSGESPGGDLIDDEVDQDGKNGGDEDDHDVAGVPFFDVSLIKERSAGQPYLLEASGTSVTVDFDITVTNQSFVPVDNVDVIDYVPTGMEFVELVTPNVTGAADVSLLVDSPTAPEFRVDRLGGRTAASGGNPEVPGEFVTFTVRMEIDLTALPVQSRYVNEAEVTNLQGEFDIDGDGTLEPAYLRDIDSSPDRIQGNDPFVPDPNNPDDPLNGPNDPAVDADGDGVNDFDFDPDPNIVGDEDDADTEVVELPVDLALIKTFDGQLSDPLLPEGFAVFTIEVFNQGINSVQMVEVTDYIEPVFDFPLASNLPGVTGPSSGKVWNLNGTPRGNYTSPATPLDYVWDAEGTATLTGTLAPGESVTVPFILQVLPEAVLVDPAGMSRLRNRAEISDFDDDGDPDTPRPPDVDSTPNDDPDDDNDPDEPGDPTDDEIDNGVNSDPDDPDNGGTDEDDHDIAGIPLYDLTLIKERAPSQPYRVRFGDQVEFDVTVKNQGLFPAFNVKVTEYPAIPGLGSFAIDGTATDAGLTGGITRADDVFDIPRLDPGASVTIRVVTDLVSLTALGTAINGAEISDFEDEAGNKATEPDGPRDVDSHADNDVFDDPIHDEPGAKSSFSSHDDIDYDPDGDGNVNEPTADDEDDHDGAAIAVGHDLALRKTIDAATLPNPLEVGNDVTFNIELINQGFRPVRTIDVTDTFDTALWEAFDPAKNPGGALVDSGDGDPFTYTFAPVGAGEVLISVVGDFDADETVTVPITLTIRPDLLGPNTLVNLAEISRFDTDEDPANGDSTQSEEEQRGGFKIFDIDSTPDRDPSNDGTVNDDNVDNEAGDEDDHDPAEVTVVGVDPPTDPDSEEPPVDPPVPFDLEAIKTVGSIDPAARIVVWNISARNMGTTAVTPPITITDTLISTLTFVEVRAVSAGGSCSAVGQVVTCTFTNDLPIGGVLSAQVVTQAASGVDRVTNEIVVSTSQGIAAETNTGNNEAIAAAPFPALPETGNDGFILLWIGAGFGLIGAALVLFGRPRKLRVIVH